ncbi:WSC domain-containing protein [Mycena crocata]|nr:WSC domain-containing protein [Mycena crocata]
MFAFALVFLLPNVLASNLTTLVPLDTGAPSPWDAKGCFTDAVGDRALNGSTYADDKYMTIATCTGFCRARDFLYAAVEYGKECYCGDTLKPNSIPTSPSDCNMPCTGNSAQSCGGPDRLQVYLNAQKDGPTSTPASVGDGGRWNHTGCFVDSVSARELPASVTIDGGVTAEKCTAACQAEGFLVAGCGNSLNASAAPDSDCHLRCAGDVSQVCGGNNRLTVFQDTSTASPPAPNATIPASVGDEGRWNHTGCFVDSVSARALPASMSVDGGATAEKCTNACQDKGFSVAGLEYYRMLYSCPLQFLYFLRVHFPLCIECWCGQALNATVAPEGDCSLPCAGDASQVCGGYDRLTVFQDTPPAPPTNSTQNTLPAPNVTVTTCYETSTKSDFNIIAVYKDGSPPVWLSVVTTGRTDAVLTSCDKCPTPFISQDIHHGQFRALQQSTGNTSVAAAPTTGEPLKLTYTSESRHEEAFSNFCTMTTGNATVLAVDTQDALWALCPIAAAGGRSDVVSNPTSSHGDYALKDCRFVDLVLAYVKDGGDGKDASLPGDDAGGADGLDGVVVAN